MSVTRLTVTASFLDEYLCLRPGTIQCPQWPPAHCLCWPDEQSAPLELMSSKVLSVEELIVWHFGMARQLRARPAEQLAVDDRNARAEVAGLVGSGLTGPAGPDDHKVELSATSVTAQGVLDPASIGKPPEAGVGPVQAAPRRVVAGVDVARVDVPPIDSDRG